MGQLQGAAESLPIQMGVSIPDSQVHPPSAPKEHHRSGKGISFLWGISGGTLLSVAGFVALTVYQQNTDTLNDLRNDVRHLSTTTADQVKRDEVHNRFSALWNVVKDLVAANQNLSKELHVAKATETTQDGRLSQLEQQVRAREEERKELTRELQRLRERLATVEGRQFSAAPGVGR